jgi:hypothetical protein
MNYQRQVISVSSSPSKIPNSGFSPVRLQTEIHPLPSRPRPGLSAACMPPAGALISGQKPRHASAAAHQRANRSGSRLTHSKRHSDQQHQAIPSRSPRLPGRLCCPAGSTLTTASSEPLALTHPLMDLRAGPPAQGPALVVPHNSRGAAGTRPSTAMKGVTNTAVDPCAWATNRDRSVYGAQWARPRRRGSRTRRLLLLGRRRFSRIGQGSSYPRLKTTAPWGAGSAGVGTREQDRPSRWRLVSAAARD